MVPADLGLTTAELVSQFHKYGRVRLPGPVSVRTLGWLVYAGLLPSEVSWEMVVMPSADKREFLRAKELQDTLARAFAPEREATPEPGRQGWALLLALLLEGVLDQRVDVLDSFVRGTLTQEDFTLLSSHFAGNLQQVVRQAVHAWNTANPDRFICSIHQDEAQQALLDYTQRKLHASPNYEVTVHYA